MSTYRSQDLTKLSKIVSCSNETYKVMSNRVDPYYEMTMYLVNNGVNISSYREVAGEEILTLDNKTVDGYPLINQGIIDSVVYLHRTDSEDPIKINLINGCIPENSVKESDKGCKITYSYVDPDSKVLPYTDVYYGPRKVSDIIIVEDYPGDPDYPNDKIYLQVLRDSNKKDSKTGERLVVGYRIYFKINDTVIPITSYGKDSVSSTVSGITINENGTVTIKWISPSNTGTEKEVETTFILANDELGLPESIYNKLKNSIMEDVKEECKTVLWQRIK